MAKSPNISPVTNIETSASTINTNFNRVSQAFTNTLSRDGSTPNQMEADLDMNSNDILNVGNLTLQDGRNLDDIVDEVEELRDETEGFRDEAETIVNSIRDVEPRRSVDNFTGNGSQTTFTTTEVPVNKDFTMVFVDGIYQEKDSYEVVGNQIIFDVAPSPGASIEITVLENSTVGVTDAAYVSYGDGSVADALDELYTSGNAVRFFASRQDYANALPGLSEGDVSIVRGVGYMKDSTATGMNSALWDMDVDGCVATDRPLNAYVSGFHDHNSPRVIRLYSSSDGVAWGLLNTLPLEHDTGIINGGNPVITYHDGWFWLLVSFTSVGNYDFRIYKTRDFTAFEGPFNCNAGPTPLSSHTTPAPGGSVPANEIWGAEMAWTPEGDMYVFVSVPFGSPILDIRGREIGNRRTYICKCNDLDALTFDAPTIVLPDGDDWSMIDASVTRTPSHWLLNIKDSTKQTIRVYTGPAVTGPWTFQEEVESTEYAIEGSSIIPRKLSNGQVAWDLYAEAHNTIDDWISAQFIMVWRGTTATSGWSSVTPTKLRSTRGIRHGTPLNMGFTDPEAYSAFQRFATATSGAAVETGEQWNSLLGGNRTIIPNEGAIYYVTSDTVTNLTVLRGAANEFWVACLSQNQNAGINVLAGEAIPTSVSVGFGMNNQRLIKFKRRDFDERYYTEAATALPAFSVNKAGSAQLINTGNPTLITFNNEVQDVGNHFSAHGWTPPAGRYFVQGSISATSLVSNQTNTLELQRNGVTIKRVLKRTDAGPNVLVVSGLVSCNGSDTLTLVATFPGAGTKTVSGTTDVTWFEGAPR